MFIREWRTQMTHNYHKENKRISLWINKSIKEEAEKIMGNLGLTPTAVVNILYRQIIEHMKIPFEIKLDNKMEDTNERAIRLMQSQEMIDVIPPSFYCTQVRTPDGKKQGDNIPQKECL